MKRKLLIINADPIDSSLIVSLKDAFEVDVVQSLGAFQNLLEEKCLSDYDCIFMDPAMDPDPLYSADLSIDGKKTGHLLYEDFNMRDLVSSVVVWSKDLLDFYEDLLWGNNVKIVKKFFEVETIDLLVD
jgi:hypothetical protein